MTLLTIPTGAVPPAGPSVPPKLPAAGLQFGSGVIGGQPALREADKRNIKMKNQIKILLVDDHPVVRKGLVSCLSHHTNLDVAGEAGDGPEALRKARELAPDIIIMDIDLPQMDGLAVTDVLRKEMPQVKVIVMSMHRHTEYILRILQSGARGYVLKDASTDELVKAIEMVSAGESFFSRDVARVALNQFVRGTNGGGVNGTNLTNREREVLTQIAEGLSNKEIASRLGVGVRTVEAHRERIMRKLNIHSVAGLTKYAISKGLITLRE